MTLVRATALFDAPLAVLVRVIRRADVWTRTARAMDARAELAPAPGPTAGLIDGQLVDGQLMSVQSAVVRRTDRWLPPHRLLLRVSFHDDLPGLDLVAGPLDRCRVLLSAVPTAGGVQLTLDCEVATSFPVAGPVARRRARRAARTLLGIIVLALQDERAVVAAAIEKDGTVLAAQRTVPPALAGKWELPGGKVHPGETEQTALRREIAEELGLEITVGERIGDALELDNGAILRCFGARVTAGELQLREHRDARWVGPGELAELDWLPADRLLLPAVAGVLGGAT